MKKSMSVIIIFCFFISACGTLVNSSKQRLLFNSEPQGVNVKVGTQECKTPCTLVVPRKTEKIAVEKDGKEKSFEFEKKFNGWSVILGNILWILPGVVVDVVTGGAYTIESANLNVNSSRVVVDAKDENPEEEQKKPASKE